MSNNSLFKNIKKCFKFIDFSKKEVILLIIFSIIAVLISTIIPSMNGNIINNILKLKYEYVIIIALVAGLLQFFNALFNILISKYYLVCRKRMLLNIRRSVCKSIINFKIEDYNSNGGSILNKVNNDSRSIANFLNNMKTSLLLVIGNIGVLFYIFYLNKIVGLYYLVVLLISLGIHYYGIKKSMEYRYYGLEAFDDNAALLTSVVSGARDIKGLSLKTNFDGKSTKLYEEIGEYEYKSSAYLEYTNKIASFIESMSTGIMILLSIILIKNNLLTTANFIIIFMYKSNIFNFTTKLANLINSFSGFNLSCNRIFSILEFNNEEYGDKELDNYSGSIKFSDVSFGYNDKNILTNFNLDIKPNSYTAIVGLSGAGKSTIFNLITKMYSKNSGSIYLDDIEIDELSEYSLRSNISLVTQKPYLFNLSIKDNLSMIDDDFEHIKNVCREVGLSKKIDSLDNGYDTKIGDDGSLLSGGERQKLAIARVLLTKSKVLLFDEVTNNLDNESSNEIKKLIESLREKYTIIMISHNLKITDNADRILVLKDGKIVGDGNHKKLLKNKYYSQLWNN